METNIRTSQIQNGHKQRSIWSRCAILATAFLVVAVFLAGSVQAQTTLTFKPYQIHAEYPVGLAGTLYLTNNNLRIPTNGASGTDITGTNWIIAGVNVGISGAPSGCTVSLLAQDKTTPVSSIPVNLNTNNAAMNTNIVIALTFDGTQTSGSSTLSFVATGAGLPEDDFYLPVDVARIWNGPANAFVNGFGNWSDSSKWLGGAPSGNDVIVYTMENGSQTNNATSGALLTNSVIDNNYTIASLRFSLVTNLSIGATNWQNLYIQDGKTLSITGTGGFSVLKDVTQIPNKMNVAIWGTNGTLSQANESANFSILNDYQSGTAAASIVDMTGLGNCNLDVNRVAIGDIEAYPNFWNLWQTNQYSQNSTTVGAALPMRAYATWKMALTNFVKAVYVDPYNYTNPYNRNYSMEIGRTSYGGGSSGNDYIVNMGVSNVFNVDSICVGGYACLGGLLNFANTGSYAKFRGVNGVSRMSVFSLSDAAHTPFGSTAGDNTKASPGADFTKGTVDILVDRLYGSLDATNVTASGKGVSQSQINFGNGIIDANTAILGYQSQGDQTNVSYCYSLMYVTNNGIFKVNGNLHLGYTTATPGSTIQTPGLGYGQLIIGGPSGNATVQVSNVVVGGVSKASGNNKILMFGGASLIVSNSIADANEALGTLGFQNANNNSITVFIDGLNPNPIIYVTNFTTSASTGNKLVIGGVKNMTYPADVVVMLGVNSGVPISSATFDGGVVMPAGSGLSGTLTTSSTNTINLHIINRVGNHLVWRGTSVGGQADWDYTTHNWQDQVTGLMTNYDNPDTVAFDDSPGYATNINLAGSTAFTPTAINMTNNTLMYTFIGSSPNSIIGNNPLNKYGTGTLEIDANVGVSLNQSQGLVTGYGSIGNANISAGAVFNFTGNDSGALISAGVATSGGTVSGSVTVTSGGVVTNNGTIVGTLGVQSGGFLYNAGAVNNGLSSASSSLISSGATFVNAATGSFGQYSPAGGLLDVFGTFEDRGGSLIGHSVTLETGSTFIPGGSASIGSTTVTSDGTATPDAFPGAALLRQGSTNVFKIDAGSSAHTVLKANYLSFGPSATARTQNGCTLQIINTSATPFAVGQSFHLFDNGYGSVPSNTGTSTNSYPVITPAVPAAGLAWDLSQLWVNGNIGVVSATSGPSLTSNIAVDGTGTNLVAQFSWDPSYYGYRLQTLVAPLTLGLSATNWTGVNGSWTNTTVTITNAVGGTNCVFYRLSFP